MLSKYQIYISSTYSDLKEERKAVIDIILSLKQTPICYEYTPASNIGTFEMAQKCIDDSDCIILIVGERYGIPDTDGVSYVEAEYNYALSKNIPIFVFIKNTTTKTDVIDEFTRFKNRLLDKKVVFWDDSHDLSVKVLLSINEFMINSIQDYKSSNHSVINIGEGSNVSINNTSDDELDSYQEKLKNTLGIFTTKENNDIIGLMINNLSEIRQFYELTKVQANNAYKLAKNSCIAGICLIVISVLVALIFNNNQIAVATTVGGVIVEVLAGTSLFVYQKTLKQLNYYYASLHNNERFLSLINIVGKTNIKDELYSKIVESELDNLKQYEIKNDNTQ